MEIWFKVLEKSWKSTGQHVRTLCFSMFSDAFVICRTLAVLLVSSRVRTLMENLEVMEFLNGRFQAWKSHGKKLKS